MNTDVIVVGWSKEHIHLICTAAGLALLPPTVRVNRHGTGGRFNNAYVASTVANAVALRVLDLISDRDAEAINRYLKKEKS